MKVGAASAIKLAWLVVDFDGTCTVRDTTPTIACLAAAHNNGGVEQLSSFGVHERDYMEGHSRLLGGGELEAEPSAAVDVAALSAFLAALDDHSTRTTREVSRSGVLAGLDGARVAETFTAWAAGEEQLDAQLIGLNFGHVAFTWGYTMVWFLLQDGLKVGCYKLLYRFDVCGIRSEARANEERIAKNKAILAECESQGES